MIVNEDFLHYVWKFKLFDKKHLQTADGQALEIIQAGTHNHHAGPDFTTAKIKLGNTLWAGNIEIHVNGADWRNHHHESDEAYDNVILHVVYENSEDLRRKDGSLIPTLVLKGRINESLTGKYGQLAHDHRPVACSAHINAVDSFVIESWLHRMMIGRLEMKSKEVFRALEINRNNWEETFYHFVARNFGFKVNAEPFELLARSLPQEIFLKCKNNLVHIEALLFGQAGMLDENFTDDYPRQLQKEYRFLTAKYKLKPIPKHLWKFLRMRPSNFPTIRLAQFAMLIYHSNHLFSKVIETERRDDLKGFLNISASSYWETHFLFDQPSSQTKKHLGENSADNILINTFALFLFSYGHQKKQEKFVHRALALLESIKTEKNKITRIFEEIGIKPLSAFQSQALIQLKNVYCDKKKCLNCSIGMKVLNLGT